MSISTARFNRRAMMLAVVPPQMTLRPGARSANLARSLSCARLKGAPVITSKWRGLLK